MGYELYWPDVPVGEEPLCHSPARGCFELPEQDTIDTRCAMDDYGMLDLASDPPTVPAEQFGVSPQLEFYDEDCERIEYSIDTPEGLYQRAIVAVQRGDTGGRIPAWKLSSNGAWLVTPEEIGRSLAVYDDRVRGCKVVPASVEILEDDDSSTTLVWWAEWIEFLREAINRGGVEVY